MSAAQCSMMHFAYSQQERPDDGFDDSLVRFFVGLEESHNIITRPIKAVAAGFRNIMGVTCSHCKRLG